MGAVVDDFKLLIAHGVDQFRMREPDSDLATVLKGLRADILAQEDLPDPQTEWDDALRRIEFDSAKNEMAKLAASGLASEEARKRYLELSRRMTVLKGAGIR